MAVAGAAQAEAVHRNTLQEQPFPEPGYHTVTISTTIDPGGSVAAHTHPGAEMAYVLSGAATLAVAGQPPRSLAPGDSCHHRPGHRPHARQRRSGAADRAVDLRRGARQAGRDARPLSPARDAALRLLAARAPGATVCPSEVARALGGPDWRREMPVVHAEIDRLVAERLVSLSWRGQPLARRDGPYRIGHPAVREPGA